MRACGTCRRRNLLDEPHIANVIERSKGSSTMPATGPATRERVITRLSSREPARRALGAHGRFDPRLRDRAAARRRRAAVYIDVTDTSRVETALRERAEALEAPTA